jgi:hypothetical protein
MLAPGARSSSTTTTTWARRAWLARHRNGVSKLPDPGIHARLLPERGLAQGRPTVTTGRGERLLAARQGRKPGASEQTDRHRADDECSFHEQREGRCGDRRIDGLSHR